MWIKFSLFTFFLCFSLKTFPNSLCPKTPLVDRETKPIDLRSEMGPLRDQDSIGWCYSFTAADLLTHYLYKTKGSEVKKHDDKADYRTSKYAVSAVGLATYFNENKLEKYFAGISVNSSKELAAKYNKKVVPESGMFSGAINAAKENGFCYEKDLSSENFGHVLDVRCAFKGKCRLDEMLNIVFDEGGAQDCNNHKTIQKMFPVLAEGTIKDILKYSTKYNALNRLVSVACNKQFSYSFFGSSKPVVVERVVNDPSSSQFKPQFDTRTPAMLISNIDESLNKGTPVGIMYYSNFLTAASPKKPLPHGSSLVGKQFNSKTCEVEYILRNSHGKTCDEYNYENPEYRKCTSEIDMNLDAKVIHGKRILCQKQYPPLPRNPSVKCDPISGYVFIKKSDLLKNIYGLAYLEE